jgi:hypothetical protein
MPAKYTRPFVTGTFKSGCNGPVTGAILKELPGGHLFTSEHPEVFNRCVLEFVKAHR